MYTSTVNEFGSSTKGKTFIGSLVSVFFDPPLEVAVHLLHEHLECIGTEDMRVTQSSEKQNKILTTGNGVASVPDNSCDCWKGD